MKFPTAHTVLLGIAALVALLTWVVPSGEYDRLSFDASKNKLIISGQKSAELEASQSALEELGITIPLKNFTEGAIWKPIGIPGTYHETEAKPQGLVAFLESPIKGMVQSIDIILFVLILGGCIGVVHSTGSFNAGVASVAKLLKGREYWLIIFITTLTAAGGTTFGLAEETIAFYPILVPVFLAAGYDAMVAVACIYIGSSIGTLASTVNPFSVIIGSDAAGINWTLGLHGRLAVFCVGLALCIWYILRYARKIKVKPESSLVYDQKEEIEALFGKEAGGQIEALRLSQKGILIVFSLCFVLMIFGVSQWDWWFLEMTTVFFGGSLLIGLLGRMHESNFVRAFIAGAKDLLSVALIIGVARGVTVLMEEGQIADTLLYRSSLLVEGVPKGIFINLLYVLYSGLSLFVPSSSGMAVLTMPIFAPLADVVGIGREMIVNAYIFGQGMMAFINPTGLILASLTMVNVGYNKWLKFVIPLLIMLIVLNLLALTLGVYL